MVCQNKVLLRRLYNVQDAPFLPTCSLALTSCYFDFQRSLNSVELSGLHFPFFIEEWDVSLKAYMKEQTWAVISSDSMCNHYVIFFNLFNDAVNSGIENVTLRLLDEQRSLPLKCLFQFSLASLFFFEVWWYISFLYFIWNNSENSLT